eukprot:3913391-Pyramimonas_sp.AAC.1
MSQSERRSSVGALARTTPLARHLFVPPTKLYYPSTELGWLLAATHIMTWTPWEVQSPTCSGARERRARPSRSKRNCNRGPECRATP